MRIVIICLLMCLLHRAVGQRQSGDRFFTVNPYLVNPANAGYYEGFNSFFSGEIPTGAVKKNISRYTATFQYPFKKSMVGMGGKVQYYKRGIYESTNIDVAFAYKIRLTKDMVASFGFDVGLRNNVYRKEGLNDQVDLSDPTLYSDYQSGVNLKIGLGASLISYKFEAGFSMPEIYEGGERTDFNSVLYAMYSFELNGRDFIFQPIVYGNYYYKNVYEAELELRALWMQSFWIQFGLSNLYWANAAVGYQLEQLEIGYSYEMNINAETKFLGPYHNIMVGFNLKGDRSLAYVRPLRFRKY